MVAGYRPVDRVPICDRDWSYSLGHRAQVVSESHPLILRVKRPERKVDPRLHPTLKIKNAKVKVKKSLYGHGHGTEGYRSLRISDFKTIGMDVVRSEIRTGHLYPPGNIPGTYFC